MERFVHFKDGTVQVDLVPETGFSESDAPFIDMELVDGDRCTGCAYSVEACPYGVRFMNLDTGNADKCTWRTKVV